MARRVAPALHAIARLFAVAKRFALVLGRGRPTVLATMDDRLLRDIGLSRHDLWDGTAEPLFRAPAGHAVPLGSGRTEPGRSLYERRSHRVLTRAWAEDMRSA